MVTAAQKNKATEGDSPKAKRKVLTPAERIAKAEADLQALREKAHEKDAKAVAKIDDQLKVKVEKRDALNEEIAKLETEKAEAQARIAGPVTDGVGEADDES